MQEQTVTRPFQRESYLSKESLLGSLAGEKEPHVRFFDWKDGGWGDGDGRMEVGMMGMEGWRLG